MKIKVNRTKDFEFKKGFVKSSLEFFKLVDCTDGAKIKKPAKVALQWSSDHLYVYFWVEDDHIWGTYKKDNDPIYNEEVVEAFLAFGESVPKKYFEFQFSPNAVKYCAIVKNPTGDRNDAGFKVKTGVKIDGLEFRQQVDIKLKHKSFNSGTWKTVIKIPALSIKGSSFVAGNILRANFYRIDGYPKQNSFQVLNPNFEIPANFHIPEKFATLTLEK